MIRIGNYVLDVDVEATRQGYAGLPLITENCLCDSCENYLFAVDSFPEPVRQLFASLGVDVRRASEVFSSFCEDRQEFSYGGFYPIVGRILEQEETLYFQVNDRLWKQNPEMVVRVADKFSVWFTEDCSLVPDGFPQPHLQMEISFYLPWVLARPYWEVPLSLREWKRCKERKAVLSAKRAVRRCGRETYRFTFQCEDNTVNLRGGKPLYDYYQPGWKGTISFVGRRLIAMR